MRDVRLPNGTVIKGVPDDATKEQVMQKAINAGLAKPKDFGAQPQPQQPRGLSRTSTMTPQEQSVATAENAAALGSNIAGGVAENLVSVAQASPFAIMINRGMEALGFETASDEELSKVPGKVREMLNYKPRSRQGKLMQQAIAEETADAIKGTPIEYAMDYASEAINGLRKNVEQETGSKVVANAAIAAPELLLDVIPAALPVKATRGLGKTTRKDAIDAFVESEVDLNKLKQVRDAAYDELDAEGVRMRGGTTQRAVDYIEKNVAGQGYDIDLKKARPLFNKLRKFNQPVKYSQDGVRVTRNEKLGDLERIRQYISKNAPRDEPGLAAAMASSLDQFIDSRIDSDLLVSSKSGKTAEEAKKGFKSARALAGRVIRTQQIDEMFEVAANDANPGRTLQRKMKTLLNNPKRRRYYSEAEIEAMREISRGELNESDIMKFIGRAGIDPGSAAEGVARFLKIAGGSAFRRMPIIGSARRLRKVLNSTDGKAVNRASRLVRNMVAAGDNGTNVIKTYLKNVPKGKRDPAELAQFLADPKVDLDAIELKGKKLEREALEMARGIRFRRAAVGTALNEGLDDDE